jgi:predicted nucleic acid-binding protein
MGRKETSTERTPRNRGPRQSHWDRRQLLAGMVRQGNVLACCPINITEVYAGLRPREEEGTAAFLQTLHLYPLDWPIARLAGLLKRDYSKKGKTLNLGHVLIAATALHHNLALLTDNTKDFPMPDLSLYPLPE